MGRYSTASKAWVAWLAIAAAAITIWSGPPNTVTGSQWLALLLLGLCGAIAHLFPIRSALGGATFTVTNVLLIAGAAILPPPLITPLAILALTPERWKRRGRPGFLIGWLFNVSQSAIALHAASAVAEWAHIGNRLSTPFELAAILGAAAVFTLTQDVLVGVIISLQTKTHLFKSDTFRLPALMTDGLMAIMGIVVTGLWLNAPLLLGLLPPLLILMVQMTKTAHLAHLAGLDVKTGLHNYRHFERVLEEELARGKRVGMPLAVLFADIDHFKQVNDRHGHAIGDQVLLQIANVMTSVLRKTDVVARFGGEEFVALLPSTDIEHAVHLAERVRAAVESHGFTLAENGATLRCTISIGVAASPNDATDAITLMKLADEAVYNAKRTRNAVARPADMLQPVPVAAAPAVEAPRALPRQARAVMWACILGGGLFTIASLIELWRTDAWLRLWPLLLLAVAAEFLGVRIYEAGRDRISYSLSGAATLLTVTALPAGAPLVSFLAAAVHILMSNRKRDVQRTLFNVGNPPLAAGAAVCVIVLMRPLGEGLSVPSLLAFMCASLAFWLFNSGYISLLISLHTRQPVLAVVRQSGWSAPIGVFLGLTGAFLGGAHDQLGVAGTLVFIAPVVIMRLTLDLYARRSQQAIDTLQTLNGQLEAEISQRKRFEETLEHQALHDPLTDFPNRSYLLDRLRALVTATEGAPTPFALLLLDLDRFKDINDTFGHQYGDMLLQEVGQRLRDGLGASDTIARLGGDEFGILLPGVDIDGATAAARTILEALEQPLQLEGQLLEVGASVGIAWSPLHGHDPDILLRRADVAMYVAKRGHTHLAVYDAEQDHHSPARLQLVGELRRAIDSEGLVLHYQPKASMVTGEIISVEALVRWQHAQHGMIPPDQFIPLAENTGLIRPLSRWVLNAALAQCRAWQDAGLQLPVSVNLSMRDLLDATLPEAVGELLRVWRLEPSVLKLEITESAVMADAERAIDILGRLRVMGVSISVDDFGTGYASLSYLKRLPVDELKIDRSFVRQLAQDQNDVAIVRSTIQLAHDLGLRVVAEGIEDLATWDVLAALSCDVAQGYMISRPLAAADLVAWLERTPAVERRAA